MENKLRLWAYIILSFSLITSSIIIGNSIKRFKNEDRVISVKGFAEKEVKADLAIWTIIIRVADNNLVNGNNQLAESKNKVIDFLLSKGLSKQEINSINILVIDNQANEYATSNQERYRYIIEETVEVRSNNVDLVQQISRMSNELLKAGVALSTKNDWRGSGIEFYFTKLNTIKPQMISEAIKNAREAATQFALDNNIPLGKLKRASQGLFSIQDRDHTFAANPDDIYSAGSSGVMKKVRVVISVDYSIE